MKDSGIHVGSRELEVINVLDNHILATFETIKSVIDDALARRIAFKMHENTKEGDLGREWPLSAYFTHFQANSILEKARVLLEWGEIIFDGNKSSIKLHSYLNGHINRQERWARGATIVSGHIGRILIPPLENYYQLALLDTLKKGDVLEKDKKEFPIIMALLNEGVFPINSDGYPVDLKFQ